MKKILLLCLFFSTLVLHAQDYFPINSGVKTTENTTVAFTNANIYVTPTQLIKKGTLLIKDGKVMAVGKRVAIPKGAQVIDVSGKSIYPSFVEVFSDFGMTVPKAASGGGRSSQYEATRSGYYWNDHIRPETKSFEDFKYDNKKASALIKAGFGTVNTHLPDGIMQGNGMLVALNSNSTHAFQVIDTRSAQYLSFRKSRQSRQSYPTSIMGSMALIRQTYLDADWYAKGNEPNKDLSLEALNNNKDLVQIFDAGGNNLNSLRADKIGDEFGIQYNIVGSGDEYERINEIKNTKARFIVPINFTTAYDVSNPFLTNKLELRDMRKWNQEPSNLAVLAKNGVEFSITTNQLKSLANFQKNIIKAIKYGLDKTKALEALTTIPAKILGKSSKLGNLNTGSFANFLITSGELFDSSTKVYENWVMGTKNVIIDMDAPDISGDYVLKFNNQKLNLSIANNKGTVKAGAKKLKSKFQFKDDWIHITINNQNNSTKFTRFIGTLNEAKTAFSGKVVNENGNESNWTATKIDAAKKGKNSKKKKSKNSKPFLVPVTYPNVGFGFASKPKQETILVKNATVWTNESAGILSNTDVLLKNGKIAEIGKNLKVRGARKIDGTGKFLTAGIVDEHSHIAASAINESGHNSSAEVTMEDAINPEDMAIYRDLAGGVTTVQLLHGSANPIGGRSAILKLKWGASAADMIYKNSPKFIKFALGENVKQSNWNGTRFPQTRMGVEQVFTDYFQRAKEYGELKKSGKPYRKDLEMETLDEILNSKRFITCHSYVQSEINMLMKVAEKFNFRINTFTHILEGYKVADKMKKHGVGGSTFADWWAYKYEVKDAIPYNAAIMHNQGITVAINSDDAEMSRRLNQEAAKTVKYGGMSEIEAWKMVTLNPAKLLHIDNRVGSIKVGKEADVVLWSGNPLSIYSKAEKTIVGGIVYFDIDRDLQLRKSIKKERNMLINMMLNEKNNGGKVQQPRKMAKRNFTCDTEELQLN